MQIREDIPLGGSYLYLSLQAKSKRCDSSSVSKITKFVRKCYKSQIESYDNALYSIF